MKEDDGQKHLPFVSSNANLADRQIDMFRHEHAAPMWPNYPSLGDQLEQSAAGKPQ
jgi:hypothetical protein